MKRLSELHNVGKAVLQDLQILEITSVKQLSECDPTILYRLLENRTGAHHDPCVWDVFAAIIHEAKTGEKIDWWKWTLVRKEIFKNTNICECGK